MPLPELRPLLRPLLLPTPPSERTAGSPYPTPTDARLPTSHAQLPASFLPAPPPPGPASLPLLPMLARRTRRRRKLSGGGFLRAPRQDACAGQSPAGSGPHRKPSQARDADEPQRACGDGGRWLSRADGSAWGLKMQGCHPLAVPPPPLLKMMRQETKRRRWL